MSTSVNLRNVLVLLGLVVTSVTIIYFAIEFGRELSDWGRVIDLALLTVVFVALGAHFGAASDPAEVVERSGWRWLKVTNAFYVLGAVCALAAVIAFFAVDGLRPIVKVIVSMLAGIALIAAAATRMKHRGAPGHIDRS